MNNDFYPSLRDDFLVKSLIVSAIINYIIRISRYYLFNSEFPWNHFLFQTFDFVQTIRAAYFGNALNTPLSKQSICSIYSYITKIKLKSVLKNAEKRLNYLESDQTAKFRRRLVLKIAFGVLRLVLGAISGSDRALKFAPSIKFNSAEDLFRNCLMKINLFVSSFRRYVLWSSSLLFQWSFAGVAFPP